ncbi:unnamed protein product [Penicillium salamii]|nr:unnamed protein product [Penicillium salamii]
MGNPVLTILAPIFFLHDGPEGQTSKANTVYFNPSIYRIILFDQRGTGKSTPNAELRDNTIAHLVADIEFLRLSFDFPQWSLIFGGAWGSAVAFLYSELHPDRVGSLVLRGVYAGHKRELCWSRGEQGAAGIFPEAWELFVGFLPVEERKNPVAGYYKRLTGTDEQIKSAAAREWNRWGLTIETLRVDENAFLILEDEAWSLNHAIMEAHHAMQSYWFEVGRISEPENLKKIAHIPTTIIQGRYDMVCPQRTA